MPLWNPTPATRSTWLPVTKAECALFDDQVSEHRTDEASIISATNVVKIWTRLPNTRGSRTETGSTRAQKIGVSLAHWRGVSNFFPGTLEGSLKLLFMQSPSTTCVRHILLSSLTPCKQVFFLFVANPYLKSGGTNWFPFF